MKKLSLLAAGLGLAFSAGQAAAWSQPTHKNIVKDALAYMNSAYATEEMRQAYAFYVGAAGSEAKAGEIFTELLGSNPYPDLKEAGYAFRAITLGE